MARRKKQVASTHSRDLDSDRKTFQAVEDAKQGKFVETEEVKPLLLSFMDKPGSFSDSDDNQLDAYLLNLTFAPDTNPVKQEVIELAASKPIGKSIASYLQNPAMVGRVR